MITAEEIASRQKILRVKEQIEAPRVAGEKHVIVCPYCHDINVEGQTLCCDTLRTCVITILMGKRQEKIEEAHSRYVN